MNTRQPAIIVAALAGILLAGCSAQTTTPAARVTGAPTTAAASPTPTPTLAAAPANSAAWCHAILDNSKTAALISSAGYDYPSLWKSSKTSLEPQEAGGFVTAGATGAATCRLGVPQNPSDPADGQLQVGVFYLKFTTPETAAAYFATQTAAAPDGTFDVNQAMPLTVAGAQGWVQYASHNLLNLASAKALLGDTYINIEIDDYGKSPTFPSNVDASAAFRDALDKAIATPAPTDPIG